MMGGSVDLRRQDIVVTENNNMSYSDHVPVIVTFDDI